MEVGCSRDHSQKLSKCFPWNGVTARNKEKQNKIIINIISLFIVSIIFIVSMRK